MRPGSETTTARSSRLHRPLLALVLAALLISVAVLVSVAMKNARPGPVTPAPAATGPVVFLGDSYTTGSNEGGNGDANYTHLLARQYAFAPVVAAVGGTGYVIAAPGVQPYSSQLSAVARVPAPRLIVVEGSRNDVVADPSAVQIAARQLYADLRRNAPTARIVVIGPIVPVTGTLGGDILATRDAVRAAATDAGLPFIDPIADRWLDGAMIGTDGVHPTDSGHARIAAVLGADLKHLGEL